jgi:metal-responsive CopG/Arc/MetJ family transcriptional regulator
VGGQAVTVRLDRVQLAWLDALADVHDCTRAAVLREALRYFIARESVRIQRTRHYAIIGLISRSERWDPVSDYLAGREVQPP